MKSEEMKIKVFEGFFNPNSPLNEEFVKAFYKFNKFLNKNGIETKVVEKNDNKTGEDVFDIFVKEKDYYKAINIGAVYIDKNDLDYIALISPFNRITFIEEIDVVEAAKNVSKNYAVNNETDEMQL